VHRASRSAPGLRQARIRGRRRWRR
jgi:hypothetical protein